MEEPIKILGIWIHQDFEVIQKLNFEDRLDHVEKLLNGWRNRSLTLMGKICVINSLVASPFSHKLMSLPSPSEKFFMKYKKIINEFLWNGKISKIRYEKIIQNYENGGLKLVHLPTCYIQLFTNMY